MAYGKNYYSLEQYYEFNIGECCLLLEAIEAYWSNPQCIKGDFKLLREKLHEIVTDLRK